MKKVGGVWLPGPEQHLVPYLDGTAKHARTVDGRGTYQYHKLEAALAFVKDHRVAVDVGAHCGLWAMHLVKSFGHVLAFEPVAHHRQCFVANVQDEVGRTNFVLHPIALGDRTGEVVMRLGTESTGDTHPAPDNAAGDTGAIPLRRFDALYPDLIGVDLIKLDCEGYELFALKGAEQMLRRCRPVVIVEQKPGKAAKYGLGDTDAVTWLQSLGFTLRQALGGDYILTAP